MSYMPTRTKAPATFIHKGMRLGVKCTNPTKCLHTSTDSYISVLSPASDAVLILHQKGTCKWYNITAVNQCLWGQMVLMIFKMRSSLLTTLVTGEQSFFLTASGPFVLAEFPQQLPCACTCELSFSLLCRITNIAGQLVRNECNILSLGGIKASEVPLLQEQQRILFGLAFFVTLTIDSSA